MVRKPVDSDDTEADDIGEHGNHSGSSSMPAFACHDASLPRPREPVVISTVVTVHVVGLTGGIASGKTTVAKLMPTGSMSRPRLYAFSRTMPSIRLATSSHLSVTDSRS